MYLAKIGRVILHRQDQQKTQGRASWRVLLLLLTVLLAACQQEPAAELTIPIEDVPQRVVSTMAELEGFRFEIDHDGAFAYLDSAETLAFGGGIGDYVAPDKARAQVSILAPGLVTRVSVVSVGAVQWETNVLTGVWTELPPEWGFNPSSILDANNGLLSVLATDSVQINGVTYEALPDVDSPATFAVLDGQVEDERIHSLSGRLIDHDPLKLKLWVDPETYLLHQLEVVDPPTASDADEEETIWTLQFSEFGRVVEITPPDVTE